MSKTNEIKKYLFTIEDLPEGLNVGFESLEENEDQGMTVVDGTMIMLAISRMLLDEGLSPDQLKEFLDNVHKYALMEYTEEDNEKKEENEENEEE
jgi:hypothetical protein